MFEHKLATNIKQDSKSFFAYIRSKQRVKDSIGPLKGSNGAVISNNKEMAESLNEYFSTVFTLEDTNALPATEQLLEDGKTCLEKWQMLFNKDKCKCLHIGQANAKNNYLMNNTVLLSTEREKDVGVVVSSDMKVVACGMFSLVSRENKIVFATWVHRCYIYIYYIIYGYAAIL